MKILGCLQIPRQQTNQNTSFILDHSINMKACLFAVASARSVVCQKTTGNLVLMEYLLLWLYISILPRLWPEKCRDCQKLSLIESSLWLCMSVCIYSLISPSVSHVWGRNFVGMPGDGSCIQSIWNSMELCRRNQCRWLTWSTSNVF